MAPNKIDFDALLDELAAGVTDAVRPFVEGAAADIDGFGRQLAQAALDAVKTGDEKLVRMAKNQIPWFLETNRLRAVNAEYASFQVAVDVGFKALAAGAKYFLGPFGGLAAVVADGAAWYREGSIKPDAPAGS